MINFVCVELYLMMLYQDTSNTDLYVTYLVPNCILTSLDSFHSVFNYIILRILN